MGSLSMRIRVEKTVNRRLTMEAASSFVSKTGLILMLVVRRAEETLKTRRRRRSKTPKP